MSRMTFEKFKNEISLFGGGKDGLKHCCFGNNQVIPTRAQQILKIPTRLISPDHCYLRRGFLINLNAHIQKYKREQKPLKIKYASFSANKPGYSELKGNRTFEYGYKTGWYYCRGVIYYLQPLPIEENPKMYIIQKLPHWAKDGDYEIFSMNGMNGAKTRREVYFNRFMAGRYLGWNGKNGLGGAHLINTQLLYLGPDLINRSSSFMNWRENPLEVEK